MTTHPPVMTAEHLRQLSVDGWRDELVRGTLRWMAPAGSDHGAIVMNIPGPLHHYLRTQDQGIVYAAETRFLLSRSQDTVRAPDAAFVTRDRVARAEKVCGCWPGVICRPIISSNWQPKYAGDRNLRIA
jgi:hypothetical protein